MGVNVHTDKGVENSKVHMGFTAHFRCLHCSERIYNILMMKFMFSKFLVLQHK